MATATKSRRKPEEPKRATPRNGAAARRLTEANGKPKPERLVEYTDQDWLDEIVDAVQDEASAAGGMTLEDDQADQVLAIPLAKLHDHPANPDPSEGEIVQMMAWLQDHKQLEPVTVRPMPNDDPPGHYEILAGKTRRAAALRLGWETLDGRVRYDLDDNAAAIEVMAGTNQQRRAETPIRQALMIEAMMKAGRSAEAAGAMYGLTSASAVRNKLGLLKLPEPWRGRVVSGEMPETAARCLVPYVEIKALMKLFDQDYKTSRNSCWVDEHLAWTQRRQVAETIEALVRENSRGLEPDDKRYYGHQVGDHPTLFELTPAIEKKLQVVSLPIAKSGKLKRVALNVKEYDKLNKPLAEAAAKKKAERSAARKRGAKKKATKKKLSPAEARKQAAAEKAEAQRRTREAAKKTAAAIADWRLRFLRCMCFDAIKPGDWRVTMLLPLVMSRIQQRENQFRTKSPRLDRYLQAAAAVCAKQNDHCPSFKLGEPWDEVLTCVSKDRRQDEVTAAEELQAMLLRILIWPQVDGPRKHSVVSTECPQPWRYVKYADRAKLTHVFLLELEPKLVEQIAELLKVKIADGWKRAGIMNSRERAMVTDFLELHTRDQLDKLAAEICTKRNGRNPRGGKGKHALVQDVKAAKSKAGAIEILLSAHMHAAPLQLPKCLAVKPKSAAKRRR